LLISPVLDVIKASTGCLAFFFAAVLLVSLLWLSLEVGGMGKHLG
jgi:hypothetical protein